MFLDYLFFGKKFARGGNKGSAILTVRTFFLLGLRAHARLCRTCLGWIHAMSRMSVSLSQGGAHRPKHLPPSGQIHSDGLLSPPLPSVRWLSSGPGSPTPTPWGSYRPGPRAGDSRFG